MSDATETTRRRRFPLRPFLLGIAIGMGGAVFGLLVVFALRADPLPRLSREEFEAASRRWAERGPKSYRMDIRLGGRQPGLIHVEVRDGIVTAMTLNGNQPHEQRTWDPWSVDSLLDLIGEETAAAANPQATAKKFGAPEGATVLQGAEFDSQYGYPRRYRRSVLGTLNDLEWEVTRFEPVEAAPQKDGQAPTERG